jgi:hypothetical protein
LDSARWPSSNPNQARTIAANASIGAVMWRTENAVCARGGRQQVTAMPQNGYAFWVRAVVVDDEKPQEPGKWR